MFLRGKINGDHMVVGTGIDIVANDRFQSWVDSPHRLSKIFTQQEVVHYLHEFNEVETNVTSKHALEGRTAYWAARFAAKEAFFKALSVTLVRLHATDVPFSLMFACQNVEVIKGEWQIPMLHVRWKAFEDKIGKKLPRLYAHLSLAHEKQNAVASVTISL